jgi:hypothetical protein
MQADVPASRTATALPSIPRSSNKFTHLVRTYANTRHRYNPSSSRSRKLSHSAKFPNHNIVLHALLCTRYRFSTCSRKSLMHLPRNY